MSAWRRSPCGLLGLLAALGCALISLPAAHAGRHSSRRGGGRELLATAQAQAGAGNRAAARATLEQAYRLTPSAEVLCALADLAAQDGRILEAQDARRRCTAGAARAVPTSPAASLPASGELSISGPRRALVVVDEHVVGALPLPLPLLLAPGPHQVVLEAGSHRWAAAVKVLPGRAALLTLAGQAKVTLMPAVALLVDFSRSPTEAAPLLRQAAAHALQSRRLGLVGQWGALGERLELSGCQDAPCEEALAQKHKVRYVVAARAAAEPDGWQLWAQLFDAEVGGVASEQASDCERCTIEQAGQRLSELLTLALTAGQSRPTGVLEITSTPPGGDVLLAGLRLGQTPLRRIAFAGEHAIVVQRPGFAPYQNEVVVEPGRGAALDATLRASTSEAASAAGPPTAGRLTDAPRSTAPLSTAPPSAAPPSTAPPSTAPLSNAPPSAARPTTAPLSTAPPSAASVPPDPPPEPAAVLQPRSPALAPPPPRAPGRTPRPRWRVGLGVAASAAGAALTGFGVAGLALDGRCTQTPLATAGGELCASGRVVDSGSAGVGLLAAGIATLGAGTLLWSLPGARKLEVSAAVTPTPNAGGALAVGGSF